MTMRHLLFILLLISSTQLFGAVKDSIGTKVKDGKRYIVHKVESGETLYGISKKYRVSVTDIKNWNGMEDNNIDLNQELLILSKDQSNVSGKTHKVAAGETLYSISKKYNIGVQRLKSLNKLASNNLEIGQVLIISPDAAKENVAQSSNTTTKHIVVKGETLYSIARKYKVSVSELKNLNQLTSNEIEIGQTLIVQREKANTAIKPNKEEFIKETGIATLLTHEDYQEKFAYCFHKTAPKGTIIKVTNAKGESMFVRVMGKCKDGLIQVNPTVMNKLGTPENKFDAKLTYYL